MDVTINIVWSNATLEEAVSDVQRKWASALTPVRPPAIVLGGHLAHCNPSDFRITVAATNIPVLSCLDLLSTTRGASLTMGSTYVMLDIYEGCVTEWVILPVSVPPRVQSTLGITAKTNEEELKRILTTFGIEFKREFFKVVWNPRAEVIVMQNYPDEARRLSGIVSLLKAGHTVEKTAQPSTEGGGRKLAP